MTIHPFFLMLFLFCTHGVSFAIDLGSPAPPFSLKDENGKVFNSKDSLSKKHLLVFFYPAALTGGCTRQACSYRDDLLKWNSKEVKIIGISGDSPANLKLFKKTEHLNFTLLSDPAGKTAKEFGVPVSKGGTIQKFIQGERFSLERSATAKRWTFIISKSGEVIYKNNKVNAVKDSADAMHFISKFLKL
jgi:thioredoxin-dependent peroxiredoxin